MAQNNYRESKSASKNSKNKSESEYSSKATSWSSVKPAQEDDRERRDGPGGN